MAFAVVLAPVALLLFMGWQHRWTADDGFIDLRIVRQLREGHGPVFNTGDRVEVGTSPLWLALLYVLDVLLPLRLEWIAALTALGATAGGLALAVLGTRRALLACRPSAGWLLPVGALLYAAIPPAWDFATSGLETGIGLLWIGTCWWLLSGTVGSTETPREVCWVVPVVLGLGPLVRPDFMVFSVFFVAALLVRSERTWRAVARVLVLAAALPLAVELFRMAYYGNLVPNTAIAKEGSLTDWHQGWLYLWDFVGPYALVVPLGLLLACVLSKQNMGDKSARANFRTLAVLTVSAGLAHALFVVRVGGDFMHGRMLLPALFTVLLPASVVLVNGVRWLLVGAIGVWALACAFALRTPYAGHAPAGPFGAYAAINHQTGIGDERLYYTRLARSAHPVTIDDYLSHSSLGQAGVRTRAAARSGRRGLLVHALLDQKTLLPLREGVHAAIVASAPAIGIYSYAAGDSVAVVDDHGLADSLAAHQRLVTRARPGHEKNLPEAWLLARWLDPASPIPATVSRSDVIAAHHALTCGPLRELLAASNGPLNASRAFNDLLDSPTLYTFRFATDPKTAERELCRRDESLG